MEFIKQPVSIKNHQVMTYFLEKPGNKETLILIHGGPGATSRSLRETHHIYLEEGYNILTWDQLGCGESAQPEDDSNWNLEYFVSELEEILSQYNVAQVHLLGRSWGGIIAQSFALKNPQKVKSLILGATTSSCPLMQKGFIKVKQALGLETYLMMERRQQEGSTEHPEYKAAVTLLMYRHLCRLEQWPEAMQQSLNACGKKAMSKIFGKFLFNCDGNIKDFDCSEALGSLNIPSLIMHGEHDYISLDCAELLKNSLAHSSLIILKNCSHMSFYEDPKAYSKALVSFLAKNRDKIWKGTP